MSTEGRTARHTPRSHGPLFQNAEPKKRIEEREALALAPTLLRRLPPIRWRIVRAWCPARSSTAGTNWIVGFRLEDGRGLGRDDLRLRCDVAIKVLQASVASDHEHRIRFRREASLLTHLQTEGHAGIDYFFDASYGPVLVMELIRGSSLASRIAEQRWTVEEAIDLGIEPLLRAAGDSSRLRNPSRYQASQHYSRSARGRYRAGGDHRLRLRPTRPRGRKRRQRVDIDHRSRHRARNHSVHGPGADFGCTGGDLPNRHLRHRCSAVSRGEWRLRHFPTWQAPSSRGPSFRKSHPCYRPVAGTRWRTTFEKSLVRRSSEISRSAMRPLTRCERISSRCEAPRRTPLLRGALRAALGPSTRWR